MTYKTCEIFNAATKELLFPSVLVPDDFWSRARGLLGRRHMTDAEGMLFLDCNAIHMLGMKISLDVLFLDSFGRIIHCAHALKPWRLARVSGASATLEVCRGSVYRKGLRRGMALGWNFT